jgi:hypothetical protein
VISCCLHPSDGSVLRLLTYTVSTDGTSASFLEYMGRGDSWGTNLKLDTIVHTLTQHWDSFIGIPSGEVQYISDEENSEKCKVRIISLKLLQFNPYALCLVNLGKLSTQLESEFLHNGFLWLQKSLSYCSAFFDWRRRLKFLTRNTVWEFIDLMLNLILTTTKMRSIMIIT